MAPSPLGGEKQVMILAAGAQVVAFKSQLLFGEGGDLARRNFSDIDAGGGRSD